jgi:ASC-1-like (ASCH) protein
MSYTKELFEPWFSLVKFNIKTCEGFLHKDEWKRIENGCTILFFNNELGFERKHKVKAIHIKYFLKIHKFLESESMKKCLPGVENIKDGVDIYRKYFSIGDENINGIVSVKFISID